MTDATRRAPQPPPAAIPAARIIARTATAFLLLPADITGPSRRRPVVRARQAAAWVLRHSPHFIDHSQHGKPVAVLRSLPRIARLLGRSDHSSVVYHLAQAEQFRASDPHWRTLLDSLLRDAALAVTLPPLPPPLAPMRQIRRRNDFTGADADPALRDSDAVKRQRGTMALAAALGAYHQERAA